jgi:hypothetical protein
MRWARRGEAVASVCFRRYFIRHEFSPIGLSQALANGHPFLVRHRVDAGAPRHDFAHIFRQVFLVFPGPGFGEPQGVFECLDHHDLQYSKEPAAGRNTPRRF